MSVRPFWSLPIFRIIAAFKFLNPSFIVMSGDNGIKILRNIFKFNGYSFWAFSLDALLEMRHSILPTGCEESCHLVFELLHYIVSHYIVLSSSNVLCDMFMSENLISL